MSQKKAKMLRKYLDKNFPPTGERIKAEKLMKGFKKRLYLTSATPKTPKPLSKKMKSGESYGDLMIRRKACNNRRRVRESIRRS